MKNSLRALLAVALLALLIVFPASVSAQRAPTDQIDQPVDLTILFDDPACDDALDAMQELAFSFDGYAPIVTACPDPAGSGDELQLRFMRSDGQLLADVFTLFPTTPGADPFVGVGNLAITNNGGHTWTIAFTEGFLPNNQTHVYVGEFHLDGSSSGPRLLTTVDSYGEPQLKIGASGQTALGVTILTSNPAYNLVRIVWGTNYADLALSSQVELYGNAVTDIVGLSDGTLVWLYGSDATSGDSQYLYVMALPPGATTFAWVYDYLPQGLTALESTDCNGGQLCFVTVESAGEDIDDVLLHTLDHNNTDWFPVGAVTRMGQTVTPWITMGNLGGSNLVYLTYSKLTGGLQGVWSIAGGQWSQGDFSTDYDDDWHPVTGAFAVYGPSRGRGYVIFNYAGAIWRSMEDSPPVPLWGWTNYLPTLSAQ